MSLAAFIDMDEFMKNRVITLRYRHPACLVCGRERHQSEWRFINGSTLEAWCHSCFKEFNPEVSRIFDPENETWEISDGPAETNM